MLSPHQPAADSAAAQALRARAGKPKGPTDPTAFPPVPTATPAPGPVTSSTVPATDSVERIHLKALIASPLNPRKTFPEEAIAELADSIAENGLLQPLTAREATDYLENMPSAREVYIGGRRLRALEKLFAEGRWPLDKLPDHLVPVIRRDVGDLELLQIAVAENVNRQDMHPLEEGDAFALLRERGKSTEEIAAAYGKGKRWVELRIQVATGLDAPTRALFAAGTINMETARTLVRLKPAERKGVVKAIAQGDAGYDNAKAIQARIAEGLPEVSKALFDLSLYTGEYTVGGRHSQTQRFADAEQFRELQAAAIGDKAAELARKWAFVEQIKPKAGSHYLILSDYGFDKMYSRADPAVHGAVIAVRPDLTVEIVEGVCRGKAPPEPTKAEAKAAGDPVAAIGAGWREHAHRCKTVALQSSILRVGHRAALELAIIALLGDGTITKIRTENAGPESRALAPELLDRLQAWRERIGAKFFDTLNPDSRTDSAFLTFKPGYQEADRKPRAGVYDALGRLTDPEVADLFDLLVAARSGSWSTYNNDGPSLGDEPLTIMAAERYQVDMAAAWRIDADYLAKLQRADLLALAEQINAWCKAHRRPNLPIGMDTMAVGRVADVRALLARHVAENDVRLVPAELTFADRKTIEKALRTPAKPKAPEPVQLDLVDAVAAAETRREKIGAGLQRLFDDAKPTTARVCWNKADTLEIRSLLAAVAAALPYHPAFGEQDVFLSGDAGRLHLDASLSVPGEYWIIGIEGRYGREKPDEITSMLRRWVQSVEGAPAPAEQPVDQAAEDDTAIDQLFGDTAGEEEEERPTIAFVRSPYCDLPQELLDSLSDALPRHQSYGAASIRITAADATITLTCETVDEPDGGDPDSYILTGYLDDTLLRDKEPLPGSRCADVITAWIASLTMGAA